MTVRRCVALFVGWLAMCGLAEQIESADLSAGFASADITPEIKPGNPVWIAGFGMGRRATGVHDPLMTRTVVLRHGDERLAWVSVDLVGLQYPEVQRIRERLKGFRFVMVSSTHNHEGPDVIGIWGRSPLHRGVDPLYIDQVIDKVVETVREADRRVEPVTARYGTADDETLLGDSRLPHVKDGVLRAIRLTNASGKNAGLIVQWNCHPESMGGRNTLITADFPYATIEALQRKFECPVVYLSGAVGGLMAPPEGVIFDDQGKELKEGEFEYARRYGLRVADLASTALERAEPLTLTPFTVSVRAISVPVENKLYRVARVLGVLKRNGREWTGDPDKPGQPMTGEPGEARVDGGKLRSLAIDTEVAYMRLGDLHVACIPGEIYPELVYGGITDPAEPNVDFPDAPKERSVADILKGDKWMLFGLANDEIGYIIPRRQWDHDPPFAYGKPNGQYGEINSCSAEVAPIIMSTLARCVEQAK